jgi:hypothetical protein
MHQRPGNDNIHTSLLPNPADVQQDQSPTATALPSLNERRTQANEPPPNAGSEERQSGVATVMAGPVTDAIMPATASSPTALIKLGQDFVRNSDFSSARLLLRRGAEAGSAAPPFRWGRPSTRSSFSSSMQSAFSPIPPKRANGMSERHN